MNKRGGEGDFAPPLNLRGRVPERGGGEDKVFPASCSGGFLGGGDNWHKNYSQEEFTLFKSHVAQVPPDSPSWVDTKRVSTGSSSLSQLQPDNFSFFVGNFSSFSSLGPVEESPGDKDWLLRQPRRTWYESFAPSLALYGQRKDWK